MDRKNKKGQNAIEYMLLFGVVALVVLAALGPNGFIERQFNESLFESADAIQQMAENICFEDAVTAWDVGSWGPCEPDCGPGTQSRSVTCPSGCCSESKPIAIQSCNNGPCCVPKKVSCDPGECGLIDDGCGNALNCGGCTAPDTCGGGGVPNECGCTPKACGPSDCGVISDGCSSTIDCGSCYCWEPLAPFAVNGCSGPGDTTCTFSPSCTLGEECVNCVPHPTLAGVWIKETYRCNDCGCIPQADSIVCNGVECGTVTECGSPVTCPDTCGVDETCVGNVCSCAPATCADLDVDCGNPSDGCGGTLDCGGCDPFGAQYECQADYQCVCSDDKCKAFGLQYKCNFSGQCACSDILCTNLYGPGFKCDSFGECTCTPFTKCPAGVCGVVDNCGEPFDCGGCAPAEQSCQSNLCICSDAVCASMHGPQSVCQHAQGQCICSNDLCKSLYGPEYFCNAATLQCQCSKLSCASYGNQCGVLDDGCGGTMNCTSCGHLGLQYSCNGSECVCNPISSCTPGQCGLVDDLCGGTIDCGGCASFGPQYACQGNMCVCSDANCQAISGPQYACDASGNCACSDALCKGILGGAAFCDGSGNCVCTPQTCAPGDCGVMSDGCGGTIDCGVCSCTPKKCHTWECGPVLDGCGGFLDCGDCSALGGQFQCSGTQCVCVDALCKATYGDRFQCAPNGQCSCTPYTCAEAAIQCNGSSDDGCGGTVVCGGCDSFGAQYFCENNQCICSNATCQNAFGPQYFCNAGNECSCSDTLCQSLFGPAYECDTFGNCVSSP